MEPERGKFALCNRSGLREDRGPEEFRLGDHHERDLLSLLQRGMREGVHEGPARLSLLSLGPGEEDRPESQCERVREDGHTFLMHEVVNLPVVLIVL